MEAYFNRLGKDISRNFSLNLFRSPRTKMKIFERAISPNTLIKKKNGNKPFGTVFLAEGEGEQEGCFYYAFDVFIQL